MKFIEKHKTELVLGGLGLAVLWYLHYNHKYGLSSLVEPGGEALAPFHGAVLSGALPPCQGPQCVEKERQAFYSSFQYPLTNVSDFQKLGIGTLILAAVFIGIIVYAMK